MLLPSVDCMLSSEFDYSASAFVQPAGKLQLLLNYGLSFNGFRHISVMPFLNFQKTIQKSQRFIQWNGLMPRMPL